MSTCSEPLTVQRDNANAALGSVANSKTDPCCAGDSTITEPGESEITVDAIAAAWRSAAAVLARWTDNYLVNRTDVWGLYTNWTDDHGVDHGSMTAPPKKQRGNVCLTPLDLERHFRGLPGQIKGLHSTSGNNTSRWVTFDLDNHGADPDQATKNLAQAQLLIEHLHDYGLAAVLEDSNGDGGFHVWVLFAAPVATETVYMFAQQMVRELGLSAEIFPKQSNVGNGYGNFLRIPGRHHARNHWSRIYRDGRWLDGRHAVEALLKSPLNAPFLLPPPSSPEELEQTGVINQQLSSTPRPGRRSDTQIARDCLQHLGADVADARTLWIKVGQILYDIDPALLEQWDRWSQQSKKYQAGECASKWKGFGRRQGKVATLGTLVYLARRAGANICFYDEPPAAAQSVPPPPEGGKIKIVVDNDEYRVADDTINVLAADPTIFQRGGLLVRVRREAPAKDGIIRTVGSPIITTLPQACLRERMTKFAAFFKMMRLRDTVIEVELHPPLWLIAAVDARGEWPGIRPLLAVSDTPILRPDGSVWQIPGYDPTSCVLYEPAEPFPTIPAILTVEDAQRAAEELLEVVCDFRFESQEHLAAWLAALLTPLARFAFQGPAPLFLFDANVRGAGKSLLALIIGWIVLGREMPVFSYSHDSEETRKQITSMAIAGDRLILLDNLAGSFGNDALDRALTSTRWKDRILGRSELVDLPLMPAWYATGNNVAVAADTTRRIIHVRLDVLEEHPEDRQDFRHPDLLQWVRQNRGRLLGAAITIVAAYLRAGRPAQKLTPFGSFEGWSNLVREAVVWIGLPDPCQTRTRLVEFADTTTDAIGQLMRAWRAYDPENNGLVASDLLATLYSRDLPPNDEASVAMRAAIETLVGCPPGKVPSARQLGNKLRAARRRVMAGFMLDTNPHEQNRNGAVWRVLAAGTQGDVRLCDSRESVSAPFAQRGVEL